MHFYRWKCVGEILQINFFPIKSCGPVQPMEIDCGIFGVEDGVFRDRYKVFLPLALPHFNDPTSRAFMVVTPENQFVTARAQPKLTLIQPLISGRTLILTAPEMPNAVIDFDQLTHGERSKNSIWDQTVNTIDCGDNVAIWLSRLILGKDSGLRFVYCTDYSSNKPLHKWNKVHKISAQDSVW